MSSRRNRSWSPQESRSVSPERRHGEKSSRVVETISERDYFVKNAEFRKWLKDEKDRYFDELSGEKARSYFAKFVKVWNRGKLSKSYYSGRYSGIEEAALQTAYKWTFASKQSRADRNAIAEARKSVGTATLGSSYTEAEPSGSSMEPHSIAGGSSRGRMMGPTLPSREDVTLARETEQEERIAEKNYKRKRERAGDKERIEDQVGPKETGREGMLEKKKVKRENDKSFRDAKDDAFVDYDDSTLMGGGDSFQARLAQREAARRRFEEKRAGPRDEKISAVRERHDAIREKERATMDMFKQMAKERFG